MNATRRKFLRAGAVSALFAGLTLSPSKLVFGQKKPKSAPPPVLPDGNPVFHFSTDTFAPYVGSEFRLATGSGRGRSVGARLEEVSDLQKDMRDRRVATHEGECFSLTFRAPAPKRAPQQDIYRVEHAALGRFSLFLVPGPARGGSVTYEAVINRIA
jgi:hypothetical protein